jgi:site-specific DNA recombinase
MFERLSGEWRSEQGAIFRNLLNHQQANHAYFEAGADLLELASRAQDLFAQQPAAEKRKLLNYVVSNCSWKDGTMTPTFRQPFD